MRRRPPSSRPPAPGRLRLEHRPSGSPSPPTASLPEPTHRLLLPCQLINRLSGQVRDIDHLIRTLSDQSLAHLMGLLPCTHPSLALPRQGAGGLGSLRLPPTAPQNQEPLSKFREGESQPCPHHLPAGSCQVRSPGCHLQFCPCLAPPARTPQLCGGPSWSSV